MNSYRKLCTEFYDIDKPHAPQDALDFYLGYAKRANGPLLEPMCGSGRFLLPLLERGFDIEGADASPEMLAACRENGAKRGLSPSLSEQFLHQLELPRRYGLILIPAGSFCLLTDLAQARESLNRLHAHMLPGARLVLEIERLKAQESHSWPWGGRWVERPDGAKIVLSWLGRYSAEEHVSYSIGRYELVKNGRLLETEFEDFNLRFYAPDEFQAMLEAAGFTAIRAWKAYRFEPPEETEESLVFECLKP